jgi:ubiquinone/menaquinone biosynthesis C-methylase UbiE
MNISGKQEVSTPAAEESKGHRWFAALYDGMSRSEEKGFLGEMRRKLLADVSGDVLEIGAGTGANFEHYAATARVVALEPDPFMLKRAEKKLAELGRANITMQRGPAESLPFPDASFDTIISTLVLCTVADPARALEEMRRVLRPGGRVLFIEHVRADGPGGRVQDAIRPLWGWFGAGCHPNRRTEATLRDAGWDVVIDERRRVFRFVPMLRGHATRSG